MKRLCQTWLQTGVGWANLFAIAAFTLCSAHCIAAEDKFDIYEIRVSGNTVLPATVIEKVLYPFLGPQGDLLRVQAAQAALATALKDAGYAAASVDIPEQSVHNGLVLLNVVEGTVGGLRVQGQRYVAGRDLSARVPSLASGKVFQVARQREARA